MPLITYCHCNVTYIVRGTLFGNIYLTVAIIWLRLFCQATGRKQISFSIHLTFRKVYPTSTLQSSVVLMANAAMISQRIRSFIPVECQIHRLYIQINTTSLQQSVNKKYEKSAFYSSLIKALYVSMPFTTLLYSEYRDI